MVANAKRVDLRRELCHLQSCRRGARRGRRAGADARPRHRPTSAIAVPRPSLAGDRGSEDPAQLVVRTLRLSPVLRPDSTPVQRDTHHSAASSAVPSPQVHGPQLPHTPQPARAPWPDRRVPAPAVRHPHREHSDHPIVRLSRAAGTLPPSTTDKSDPPPATPHNYATNAHGARCACPRADCCGHATSCTSQPGQVETAHRCTHLPHRPPSITTRQRRRMATVLSGRPTGAGEPTR
jgi:hypothetical protein